MSTFDREAFVRAINADADKLAKFRDDPKSVLAQFGLEVSDEQAAEIKEANTAAAKSTAFRMIAAPIQDG